MSEDLPKAPTAPARARRLLDRFDAKIPRERLDDARLLVSEVVTNAVEHVDAEGDIHVSVAFENRRLRIEVVDPGRGFAVPEAREPGNPRGWGLEFVRRLSDRWGVGNGDGARVWFELTA